MEDTLTWNRGAHTIMAGGNLMISNASSSGQTMVRGITLGFNTDFDPAASLFNTDEFPGRLERAADAARNTYAVLTGRVASVNEPGRASTVPRASTRSWRRARSRAATRSSAMFAQDTWRLKPNLTADRRYPL